jgi:hypothetical protein
MMRNIGKVGVILFVWLAGHAAAAGGPPALAGHWEGVILIRPAEFEVDVTLDVARRPDGGLAGELSYPAQGTRSYALEAVQATGAAVSFSTTDDDKVTSSFTGTLAADGESIEGDLTEGTSHFPFRLERRDSRGEAKRLAPVETVSADGSELKARFNADRDAVRLLLVLSPTCAICLSGAEVTERYVLDTIHDPRLKVYVVWEGIHPRDSEATARQATSYIPDPRVHHFWSPQRFAGKAFRDAVGLKTAPAWRIFLVFAPGKSWTATPPAPDGSMHELFGEEETPRVDRLNAKQLAKRVQALLDAAPSRSTAAKGAAPR